MVKENVFECPYRAFIWTDQGTRCEADQGQLEHVAQHFALESAKGVSSPDTREEMPSKHEAEDDEPDDAGQSSYMMDMCKDI